MSEKVVPTEQLPRPSSKNKKQVKANPSPLKDWRQEVGKVLGADGDGDWIEKLLAGVPEQEHLEAIKQLQELAFPPKDVGSYQWQRFKTHLRQARREYSTRVNSPWRFEDLIAEVHLEEAECKKVLKLVGDGESFKHKGRADQIALLRCLCRNELMDLGFTASQFATWDDKLRWAAIMHNGSAIPWELNNDDPLASGAVGRGKTNYAVAQEFLMGGEDEGLQQALQLAEVQGMRVFRSGKATGSQRVTSTARPALVLGGEKWAQFEDVRAPDRRSVIVSGVMLRVRLNVQAIAKIDTVEQTFWARLVVEATLDFDRHPCLAMEHGAPLTPGTWDPRLAFHNAVSIDNWECLPEVVPNVLKNRPHSICYRYRVSATFSEMMELPRFPFDAQSLQMSLYSRRGAGEVTLVPEPPNLHTFQLENMSEIHAFAPQVLHRASHASQNESHTKQDEASFPGNGQYLACVACTTKATMSSKSMTYPVVHAFCLMQRKSGYYLGNIMVPLFLITSVAFCVLEYGICEVDCMASRMDVGLGLLLTAIAFKLTIADDLPAISYLTMMDTYIFVCVLVLCLVCFETTIVHQLFRTFVSEPMETANTSDDRVFDELEQTALLLEGTDFWCNMTLLAFFVIFSISWIVLGLCGVAPAPQTEKAHRARIHGDKKGLDVGGLHRVPLVVGAFNLAIDESSFRPLEFCPPQDKYAEIDKLRVAYDEVMNVPTSEVANRTFHVDEHEVARALQIAGVLKQPQLDPDTKDLLQLFQDRSLYDLHKDKRLWSLVKGFEKHAATNQGQARPVWSCNGSTIPPEQDHDFFQSIGTFFCQYGTASVTSELEKFSSTEKMHRLPTEYYQRSIAELTAKMETPDVQIQKVLPAGIAMALMLWDRVHDTVIRASVNPAELHKERQKIAEDMQKAVGSSIDSIVQFLAGASKPLVVLNEMSDKTLTLLQERLLPTHDWIFFLTADPGTKSYTVIVVHRSVVVQEKVTDLSKEWIDFCTRHHTPHSPRGLELQADENVVVRLRFKGTAHTTQVEDTDSRDLVVFGVHLLSNGTQTVAAMEAADAFVREKYPTCAYVYAGDSNVIKKVEADFQKLFEEGGSLHGVAKRSNTARAPTCNRHRLLTHQVEKILRPDKSSKIVVVHSASLRLARFRRRLGEVELDDNEPIVTPDLASGWMPDHAGVVATLVV